MSETRIKSESRAAVEFDGLEGRVLVLAPFGRDVAEVCQVLGEAGFEAETCTNDEQLCVEVARGGAAALVAEEALSEEARRRFSATLAEQPAWSDFPLLLMTSRVRGDDDAWHMLRGIAGTGHLTVLERPLRVPNLLSAIQTALRSRRQQYQVRDELAARRKAEQMLRESEVMLNAVLETLEARVAERTAVAERRARDLRRLAAELSEAEHRERRRLAMLLHDDLQQLLLAVQLRLRAMIEGPRDQFEGNANRLEELVAECMSTSRNLTQELSPPVLQSGTLSEVIRWLGEWFADKHGLAVAVDAPREVRGVAEHLRVFLFQAVRELLFNVVKHSGKMEARVSLAIVDGALRIEVEDEGEDFDPEAVEHGLQEPESFGLFNIRERLQALLGRLEMHRAPHGGARFLLIVPIAEDPASQFGTAEPQGAKLAAQRVRKSRAADESLCLLVADDHAVVREGFVSLLDRQPGFEVVGEATDGEEAVRQAEALRPDAIVMDVEMPNLDGVEATRQITERRPEIVVIGISLHEEKSVVRAMTEAGADAFVSKHAPAKDLVETIRRACRGNEAT